MESLFKKGFIVTGKYEIQFPLERSVVYQSFRAKDDAGTIVRLDLVNLASQPSDAFSTEGQLLQADICKQLHHSNINKLLDCGQIILNKKKYTYLVFNFISGESLHERLQREGQMSPYTAVPIIADLLPALDYLHNLEEPIIHNNITPRSVILGYSDKKEVPVLSGFEFSKLLHRDSRLVNKHQLSYFHTAPELFNNVFVPQSDIFAVGALLYHLIVGRPPWFNQKILSWSDFNKIKEQVEDDRMSPPDFRLIDENLIDGHLKNTILKALAIDPEGRFASAQEFIKALNREALLEGENKSQISSRERKTSSSKRTGSGFDAVAGMADLKETLYNDVIRALNETELYESYGITIPNGMLLYGPPGCGKTFIAERLAEEIGFNFIPVIPSDLANIYVHGTQEKIGKLFQEARDNAPTIIFFDEIDAVAPNRAGDIHHSYASEVNELLAQMTNCSEHEIFVIAATNRPEKIDSALLRTGRIDKIIYVPPPDKEARQAIFELYLKSRPIDLALNYSILAESTENYVASDLKFLVDESSRAALHNDCRITMEIMNETISKFRPSISKDDIKQYDALRDKWEKRECSDSEETSKSIGFLPQKPKE